MEHPAVDDAPRHALHQCRVRDRVEVLAQIRIHNIGISLYEQLMNLLHRVLCISPRTVSVGVRLQIGFKDRFDHQLGRGLHHPVPYGRDSERSFTAVRLRDHHPPHSLRPVSFLNQFLPQLCQPLFSPLYFNLRETLAIHTR
jgi:hypothetical protein